MTERTIRRGARTEFTVLQNSAIRDRRLSLRTKGLFAVMISLPDDWSFSETGLSAFVGESRYSITKALRELEEAGYLIREQAHDDGGKFTHAVYVLQESAPLLENRATVVCENAPLLEIPSTVQPLTENQSTVTNYNKQNKDITNTPIAPKGGKRAKVCDFEPDSFERFWIFYPSHGDSGKGNKQRARVAWNKLKPDADMKRTIANAIRLQMSTGAWKRGIGIPHVSTYLNGHRWEDARELVPEHNDDADAPPPVYGYQIGGGDDVAQ